MNWFKKILFYVILILTFAVSFSSEDAKVYIDRKTEPAKLKIGVTKLKTKELEMDFSKEKKLIYAELPETVTDNHIIFVSETLDEMPSLSTTNGRRSINNIKKYLTKDIKVAPKFQYRVVVGDGENGIEEGKKYLVINCKTTLSGVYVYVVEKGSYHVQEVYKGKFNLVETLATIETAQITVENPIVWYDYNSGVGGRGHNKRSHLIGNSAVTLDDKDSEFGKNTQLNGTQWLSASGIPTYDWQTLGKHGVKIVKGTTDSSGNSSSNYTLKATEDNGKTKSSSFITFDSNNQVVFSYDGGKPEMNFGVSKYNFAGGTGKVTIVHYNKGVLEDTKKISSITTYDITLPKFDGLLYISSNYDIKANQKYEKSYTLGTTGEIEYGTVGFKDLDMRITEQSNGKGIEIRAFENIKLIPTKNISEQIIENVKLYFKEDKSTAKFEKESGVTKIKGENEKETFGTLYVMLPEGIKLTDKEIYKIEKADSNDGISNGTSPLEVGVEVGNDKNTYFKELADLYLVYFEKVGDLTVTFKNPMMRITEIKSNSGNGTGIVGNTGNIIIDKTENPNGKLEEQGNHNTKYDSQQWWEVTGAIDFPKNTDREKYSYKIIGNGINISDINGENKQIEFDGVTLNIYFDYKIENNKSYSSLHIGIYDIANYQGNSATKSFKVRWYNNDNAEGIAIREDDITVKIDSLDPTYYGKVFPINEDNTLANNYRKINEVGTGYEILKGNVEGSMTIDLGTTYRAYSRYDGVVNFLSNQEWFIFTNDEVLVKEKISGLARNKEINQIKGKIVFYPLDEGNSQMMLDEVKVDMMEDNKVNLENLPNKYAVKLLLDAENYNKLEAGKSYEIYDMNNEKDTLLIGDKTVGVGSNLVKKLNLNSPLNFNVDSGIEIEAGILDFGKINTQAIKEEMMIKRAGTYVRVKGKTGLNIEKVTVQGVTSGGETKIYKLDTEGNPVQDIKLDVTELEIKKDVDSQIKTKDTQVFGEYTLTGALTVYKTTEIGSYEGVATVEVTIVN